MTVAWSLVAVSSDPQAETLPAQRKRCEETARVQGWRLERVFEASGTGKHGPRKIFQQLMADIRSAIVKPQWVVMTRLDRVGRGSIADSAVLLQELKELGVRVWTCDSGEERLNSAMEELVVMVKLAVGKHENENRIDKAKQGHARRKARGLHDGNAPYGVTLVEGKPRPQEPQASMIRTLFEQRARGIGIRALGRYAAAHAAPKRLKNGRIWALNWDKSTVSQILRCETYRGVVIDPELFDQVSGLRKFGYFPPSKDGVWPLTGAVACTCGKNLGGKMSGQGKYRRRYYVCTSHPGPKRQPYFRAEILEQAFAVFLRRLNGGDLDIMRRPADRGVGQTQSRINAAQRQLNAAEQRRARAWEVAEEGGIAPAELRKRLEEHDEQIRALTEELTAAKAELKNAGEAARSRERASALISRLPDRWAHLEVKDQAEIARLLSRELGGLKLAAGATSKSMRIELRAPYPQSGYIALQT